jgi:hypothetical protein
MSLRENLPLTTNEMALTRVLIARQRQGPFSSGKDGPTSQRQHLAVPLSVSHSSPPTRTWVPRLRPNCRVSGGWEGNNGEAPLLIKEEPLSGTGHTMYAPNLFALVAILISHALAETNLTQLLADIPSCTVSWATLHISALFNVSFSWNVPRACFYQRVVNSPILLTVSARVSSYKAISHFAFWEHAT